MTGPSRDFGLPLHDAARAIGIEFREDVDPEDKVMTINGVRFHYLDWGKEGNPPMVLLHGGGQTCHMWDFFSLVFRDQYHIYALDQRNHGDTEWSEDSSLEASLGDVGGFLDGLGLERVYLVGFSMGGRNAFSYTALNPGRVEALTIVDVGPELNSEGTESIVNFIRGEQIFASLEEMAERVHQYTPYRSIEQIKGSLLQNVHELPDGTWSWKGRRGGGTAVGSWDSELMWKYIGMLECPTLVVRAAQSAVFSADVADKMITIMPNAVQAVIGRSSHRVVGDNPLQFEWVMRSFLDSLER